VGVAQNRCLNFATRVDLAVEPATVVVGKLTSSR